MFTNATFMARQNTSRMGSHAYLRCKPTEDETGSLSHVNMTSDVDWDPKLYDNDIESFKDFHDPTLGVVDHISCSDKILTTIKIWRNKKKFWLFIWKSAHRKANVFITCSVILDICCLYTWD
jgi:hypothetical protein